MAVRLSLSVMDIQMVIILWKIIIIFGCANRVMEVVLISLASHHLRDFMQTAIRTLVAMGVLLPLKAQLISQVMSRILLLKYGCMIPNPNLCNELPIAQGS